MQMPIPPSHDHLYQVVQLEKRKILRDQHPAPNGRTNFLQVNFQLVNCLRISTLKVVRTRRLRKRSGTDEH